MTNFRSKRSIAAVLVAALISFAFPSGSSPLPPPPTCVDYTCRVTGYVYGIATPPAPHPIPASVTPIPPASLFLALGTPCSFPPVDTCTLDIAPETLATPYIGTCTGSLPAAILNYSPLFFDVVIGVVSGATEEFHCTHN